MPTTLSILHLQLLLSDKTHMKHLLSIRLRENGQDMMSAADAGHAVHLDNETEEEGIIVAQTTGGEHAVDEGKEDPGSANTEK